MCKKLLMVMVLSFAVSSAAMAEGFYAGAGFGIVKVEDEDQGIRFSDSTFGWRVSAGYDFNRNFAIEGSYIGSGKAEDDILGEEVKVEFSSYVASLVGLIPVGDTARLFGKIGHYSAEQEVTALGMTLEEDADGFTAGVGIRFDDLGNNFAFRGEFDWYDTDLDNLWSFGVGFQYLFGN